MMQEEASGRSFHETARTQCGQLERGAERVGLTKNGSSERKRHGESEGRQPFSAP